MDARADLYALGVILFEMLTGGRPFNHESKVKLLGMHLTADVPSMKERGANVPPALDSVVHRLLSKDAKDRFDNAKDVLEALDFAMSRATRKESLPPPPGMSIPTPLKTMAMAAQKRMRMSPKMMAVGAAVAGGLVLLVAIFLVIGLVVRRGGGPQGRGERLGGDHPGRSVEGGRGLRRRASYRAHSRAARSRRGGDRAREARGRVAAEAGGPRRPVCTLHGSGQRQGRAPGGQRAGPRPNPKAKDDERILTAAKAGATSRDAQDDAFALLEGKLGPKGVEVLYDLAYGGGATGPVAARAQHVAREEGGARRGRSGDAGGHRSPQRAQLRAEARRPAARRGGR